MTPEVTAVVGAVVCAVGGLLAPSLVERLPQPEPEPDELEPAAEPAAGSAADPAAAEPPPPTYAEVAARPGLGLQTTVWSGVAGALVGWTVGPDWLLVGLLPVVPVVVALALVDLHTRLLPKRLVLPATAVVVLGGVVDAVLDQSTDDLVRGLLGLVAARSFFWVLWFVHSAGMGFGDVRLAALLGYPLAHLGWAELAVGLYSGFLLFAVPGLLLALLRWDRSLLRVPYPFGPAMIVGALLGLTAGPALLGGLAGG